MTLSEGQFLTKNLDFRGQISTFRAKHTPKRSSFKAKNKWSNHGYQLCKNGQNLTINLDFRGHIATFRAENTPKSGPFKAKNNAQTTSKQLQNKFQKVQKT